MEMYTTEPGLQFYCGNMVRKLNTETGITEAEIEYAALCLEAQHYPDSPNKPAFPNTILRPGETYKQNTIYKFSVK
jgi:aldose 1-epimerase